MHTPGLVVPHSATSRHPERGQEPRGPRHRDEVTGKHAERTNAYKRCSKVGGRKNEGGRKPILAYNQRMSPDLQGPSLIGRRS